MKESSPEDAKNFSELKAGVEGTALDKIDLEADFNELKKSQPMYYNRLFNFHMTALGNAFVARRIKKHFEEIKSTSMRSR